MKSLQIKSPILLELARKYKETEAAKLTQPVSLAKINTFERSERDNLHLVQSSAQNNAPNDTDKYGNTITYNSKQREAINLALQGKSFVLIGAAGTGKTTTIKGVIRALIDSGKIPNIGSHDHKHLPLKENAKGLIICAYTRRATNNIRRNNDSEVQDNCITIHKSLEYQPVFYEDYNSKGDLVTKMSFEATRTESNPLPINISTIVFEEASMIATDLHKQVMKAANNSPKQVIYLGDIQQLPPVFGAAVLGFKMLELPVIELTEVYRQALDSPIISLAHRVLSGNPIQPNELESFNVPDKLKIIPWQKKITAESAISVLSQFFIKKLESGQYNPEEDAILIPYNKACGSIELNNHIANSIALAKDSIVWQIIYGFKKLHLSIGDKCLYDKEDSIVLDIYKNPAYGGATPAEESRHLNYWGHYTDSNAAHNNQASNIDELLSQIAISDNEDDETKRQASHCVKLKLLDSDREVIISKTGEFNNLLLGYAITIHKSQGSEWKKVFLCLHNSHNTMMSRELLYTAITRARESLEIICEKETFIRGINSQRITGNTLEEKAEFFKGKLSDVESEVV
jgi:exodeoxyribonuclease V alpha subunit